MKNLEVNWFRILGTVFVIVLTFVVYTAQAEVIVSFERELPNKTVEFKRVFEDKDAFEMWLQDRLETKGCDPYLKNMSIDFKPFSHKDFPVEVK